MQRVRGKEHPMLELYHNGMSTCSAKARIALGAKRLEWKSHVLNLRQAEVQRPEYLKLNPDAVVPTLIHDGEVVREPPSSSNTSTRCFPIRRSVRPMRWAAPGCAAGWCRSMTPSIRSSAR
jgi:Glutathione S-transferase, N-terminal domain